MSSIILQQLQLDMEAAGKDFDHEYFVAKNYVKGIIGKTAWWSDVGAMISSEGGLARMAEHVLVFVLEEEDDIKGRQRYTSYLTQLYGRQKGEQTTSFRDTGESEITWSTLGSYSNPHAATLSVATSVDETEDSVEIVVPPRRGDDAERLEFLRTYRRVGKQEAARIYGMTPEQARNRRDTIRRGLKKRVAPA